MTRHGKFPWMQENIPMKDLHLTLPDSLAEKLNRLARDRGETRTGLVRIALEQFFDLEAEGKRKLGREMMQYALEMGEHSREFVSGTEKLTRKKLLTDTKWLLPIVALLALFPGRAPAHPSSGIVVDPKGNVFVADINTGLWKIDADGKATQVHKEAGHWLALDAAGSFSRVEFEKSERWPRWFKRRTPAGTEPALITDGGSPLIVRDGHLYYVSSGEELTPGGSRITRLSPDGKLQPLDPDLTETSEKLGGIKGLAAGPDGSLYVAYPKVLKKITRDGKVVTLADPVVVKDCDKDLPPGTPESELPFLRGLAVDSKRTVYAAATACRCVVKITVDGKVETLLKAERPWSPTGVAVERETVYVLEYPNANGEKHEDWVPRVRKVGRDGNVAMLVAFPIKDRQGPASRE